ncbi:MAG: adenine phosphoribosyltransferase [Methylacidiphilales bacterium]|nr:adenine phosphoribosyltransferase [Candidatus Methylacidiphilales bacterium]
MRSATERLKTAIRDVPDFPKPGIVFKDITPVFQDPQLLRLTISILADRYQRKPVDQIVAIDARGFLLGSALAYVLGKGVSIVRKKGKLPHQTISASYDLEYGSNTVEMHVDAIKKGQRVVVIDDVLATGGTMKATLDLVSQLGGHVLETAFFIEIGFLKGRKLLEPTPAFSIIKY